MVFYEEYNFQVFYDYKLLKRSRKYCLCESYVRCGNHILWHIYPGNPQLPLCQTAKKGGSWTPHVKFLEWLQEWDHEEYLALPTEEGLLVQMLIGPYFISEWDTCALSGMRLCCISFLMSCPLLCEGTLPTTYLTSCFHMTKVRSLSPRASLHVQVHAPIWFYQKSPPLELFATGLPSPDLISHSANDSSLDISFLCWQPERKELPIGDSGLWIVNTTQLLSSLPEKITWLWAKSWPPASMESLAKWKRPPSLKCSIKCYQRAPYYSIQ